MNEVKISYRTDGTSTREDGSLFVDTDGLLAELGGTYLNLTGGDDYTSAWLNPGPARDLAAWLNKRYALVPYTPVKGETVRIKSVASSMQGDATRGVVEADLDEDGELYVRLLDGRHDGRKTWFRPEHLAHADAVLETDAIPAPPVAVPAPDDHVTDGMIEAFGLAWARTPATVSGARRRAGIAAVLALLDADKAAPEGATPWVPQVGDVVSLLPNARGFGGRANLCGTTRVKVLYEADSEGDFDVEALDGQAEGQSAYVLPEYLAPLAPWVPSVGDVVRLLPGARSGAAGPVELREATRVRVELGPDGDGDYAIRALDGLDAGGLGWALPEFLAPVPPESAPALPVLMTGETVRLLPNPHTSSGGVVSYLAGTTRVRVLRTPDADADVWVRAVDGPRVGLCQYVGRQFLGSLVWAEGDEAELLPNAQSDSGRGIAFSTSRARGGCPTRVKIVRDMGDGDFTVLGLNGDDHANGLRQNVGSRFLRRP